jgi:hypothetical protein
MAVALAAGYTASMALEVSARVEGDKMRSTKRIVRTLVVVVVLVAATVIATGCVPELMGLVQVGIMPMTTSQGAANAYRSGLDVHEQQASWVEAGVSEKGNVKFVSPDNTVSTITTQALDAWTAIGGDYPSYGNPLIAYRTDTTGVHVVNPLTSVETTFVPLADIVPDDFGGVWLAYQQGAGSNNDLNTLDIRTGGVMTWASTSGSLFIEPRVERNWLSFAAGTEISSRRLDGVGDNDAVAVGAGTTIERPRTDANGDLSWTERDSTGYRRIYYRPTGSSETTEILPGGPSKQMGGFDGNYITWFEGYGTAAVKARAVAVDNTILNILGAQLSYTAYDPSQFAWDFDTLLWQQRGTNKLFLTRFSPIPPRIIGGNRYDTLANLARLRWGTVNSSLRSAASLGDAARDVQASAEADSVVLVPRVVDIVVTAGYANASPDAIVAPGLCGVYEAPMVLVLHDSVPASTASAIAYIRDANGGKVNIHVIGGTSAVSARCYRRLSALKGTGAIERIGGHDRYETAALVAGKMKSVLKARGEVMGNGVMLLNGSDRTKWDDAASTGAISAGEHMPVLFLRKYSVPSDTTKALKRYGLSKRYVIGGTSNVSTAVLRRLHVAGADRIWGRDKYKTSIAVARWGISKGWLSPQPIMVAGHLHEALAAGAFGMTAATPGLKAAAPQQVTTALPVILTSPNVLSSDLAAFFSQTAPDGPFSSIPFFVGGEYSVGSPFARRYLELHPDWWGRVFI